jgi:hypothetical protein
MADYLAYWQTYWDDYPKLRPLDFDWYTNDARFHAAVQPGDTIWVVVSAGPDLPSEWRLLQRVEVLRPDPAEVVSRYGKFHVYADTSRSEAFDLRGQQDLTPLLKRLEFKSGKSIAYDGNKIGQAIQRPRGLASADRELLQSYTAKIRKS